MKHLYLNLKRFDVPVEYGGVNRIAPLKDWGSYIVAHTQEGLKHYDPSQVEFVQYFPEAHILGAVGARCEGSLVQVGCQGVYRMNTAVGGNFGAFTTNRPASAARAMGCASTIIGHCEERNDKAGILAEAGVTDTAAVNRLLNQEIRLAVEQGLTRPRGSRCSTASARRARSKSTGRTYWASSSAWAWTGWTPPRWSSATSRCGPSARARPPPARTTSP